MYEHGYHRHGFRFGWVPMVLGLLLLVMLFSGGFHRLFFFVWPLFFGIPFFIAGGIVTLLALRRWRYGQHGQYWQHGQHGQHGTPRRPGEFFDDFFHGEKAKRGADDSDSDTFYV